MEKLHFESFQLTHISGGSVTFLINNEDYHATRRVANDILNGCREVYVEKPENMRVAGQKWLATPSRF